MTRTQGMKEGEIKGKRINGVRKQRPKLGLKREENQGLRKMWQQETKKEA